MQVLRADLGSIRLVGSVAQAIAAKPTRSASDDEMVLAVPDFAFQAAVPLPEEARRALHNAVFERLGPGIDLRVGAYRGRETVGAWLVPSNSRSIDEARDRGVDNLAISGGYLFGFFLSVDLIDKLAQSAWQVQPKSLRADGRPVRDGPVHLEALAVELVAPDKVVTRVSARSDETWPATHFTVTVTDTLAATGEVTSVSDASADKGPMFVRRVGTAASIPSILDSLAGRSSPGPVLNGGAGCAMAHLLPSQFLTANEKYVLYYEEVRVGAIGATFRGTPVASPRAARVIIEGKDHLLVTPGTQRVSATYTISTSDLRLDGLTVVWRSSGEIQDPSGGATSIAFRVDALQRDSPYVDQVVGVEVRDRDGFAAAAEFVVTIETLEGLSPGAS